MSKPRRPRPARPVSKSAPANRVETVPAPDGADAPPAEATAAVEPGEDHEGHTAPVTHASDEHRDDAEAAAFVEPVAFEAVAPEPTPAVIEAVAPAGSRFAQAQIKAEAFGFTVMNYVIGEGEAFAAHMRALAGARSMAEFVRLQIGEFQRAADATLTCWGMLAVSASRTAALR